MPGCAVRIAAGRRRAVHTTSGVAFLARPLLFSRRLLSVSQGVGSRSTASLQQATRHLPEGFCLPGGILPVVAGPCKSVGGLANRESRIANQHSVSSGPVDSGMQGRPQ